ncbi:hypothetical protein WMY93_007634 [Mugilogobius chulae]|uniref:Uncharacterized protein n=1 Tax=Mugilogobius chulae TaxID=88201 RepID=A0AAW0PDJ1_9GOBI
MENTDLRVDPDCKPGHNSLKSKLDPIDFRGSDFTPNSENSRPSNDSNHRKTHLDSIFMKLEETILIFVDNELKKFYEVLVSGTQSLSEEEQSNKGGGQYVSAARRSRVPELISFQAGS